MPIATTCPNCKALFRLADDMAGEKVKCQKCQNIFVVPESGDKTLAPGVSVAKPPVDMELDRRPAVPRVSAAPPDPHEKIKARAVDDDETRSRRSLEESIA